MQTRRSSAVPALAIVLPHPSLPRPISSRSLLSATSPHTPRSCGSPCSSSFFAPAANRKSTDSWNSSNQDAEDDEVWEWKAEQTLLLSRTLDALPSHLLTPFNGPVPPSNLLDKIARGVSHAKGPNEWPHSIRATRAKLLELARIRAKEAAEEKRAKSIAEEDEYSTGFSGDIVLQPTTNTPASPRKPLYRQSSMDFIASAKLDLKDNDTLSRLSNRLQRTERIIPNPTYHPYSRPKTRSQARNDSPTDRSDSYPPSPTLNPSTPSSTTLYSGSSSSGNTRYSRPAKLHRASTLSSSSSSSDQQMQALDPRVQRIRRSDSFCGAPLDKRQTLKRAPSFSASSVRSKNAAQHSGRESISPYPSSDEEEKIRTKKAKKPRVVASKSPIPTVPSTPIPASPKVASCTPRSKPKPPSAVSKTADSKSSSGSSTCRTASTVKRATPVETPASAKRPTTTRPRANPQRNPSMFGAPLPQPQAPTEMKPPATVTAPTSPATPQTKTLRRVKPRPTNFARRISFGSLVPPAQEDRELSSGRGGLELGSAFQLH